MSGSHIAQSGQGLNNAIAHFRDLLALNPFDFSPEARQKFIQSFKSTASWHISKCPEIRLFWELNKISPDQIHTESDLLNVPPVLVTIFKEWDLACVPREDIVLTLGSSGTGGQRSLQHLDQVSLNHVKSLAYKVHDSLGITSSNKFNYLCFTYDPQIAKDLGTAFTDELLTSFTGINDVFYALRPHPVSGEWFFDRELCQKMIWQFYESGIPTRILGFPAFLLDLLKNCNKLPPLGESSWVQTGGGYKNHAGEVLTKQDFRDLVYQKLKIPPQNIRDLFGMVEHGIPYVEDELGQMRIPNLARVMARDSKDLSPLPDGEPGLLHFLCSYNLSYPASSILSTDLGVVLPDPDGRGKILQILGRAGVSKAKGCAIQAQELLK
ncbi:MAG: hypothetical protein H3C47_15300 [Candidatus Cloacimonetes bacterium]|nr:hypothetical protein [Candidatus Cloacimonadota bacterium]